MITVNNCFAHWLKKINITNITKYGSGKQLILTSSPDETYQNSDTMLKRLPKKCLDKIEKLMLYRKRKVSYRGNIDQRANNSNTPADITDDNIDKRIRKFVDVINKDNIYRIPLSYFCDLGKINYPVKIDFKINC